MIYDSIYEIPSRLFFQIMETGDTTLLDSDSQDITQKLEKALKEENQEEIETLTARLKKLETIWIELEEADQTISKNPKTEKFLDVSKLMESLKCQQKKVELAITYLKINDDNELRQLLMNEGYTFSDNLEKDLERIERLNRDVNVQIEKLELQLPKKSDSKKQVPFDELVIGYGMIAGQMFRTNEITQSEFRALENNVKLKVESIPKPKNKNGR